MHLLNCFLFLFLHCFFLFVFVFFSFHSCPQAVRLHHTLRRAVFAVLHALCLSLSSLSLSLCQSVCLSVCLSLSLSLSHTHTTHTHTQAELSIKYKGLLPHLERQEQVFLGVFHPSIAPVRALIAISRTCLITARMLAN